MDDRLRFNNKKNFKTGNICYLTDPTKDFDGNKDIIKNYVFFLKKFREQIKEQRINLKNFNINVPEDANTKKLINDFLILLESGKDFTAEKLFIQSALTKFNLNKEIYLNLEEYKFEDEITKFLFEFVNIFCSSQNINIPNYYFRYKSKNGNRTEFIDFIESYLNLVSLKVEYNIGYAETIQDFDNVMRSLEKLLREESNNSYSPDLFYIETTKFINKLKEMPIEEQKALNITEEQKKLLTKIFENRSYISQTKKDILTNINSTKNINEEQILKLLEESEEEDTHFLVNFENLKNIKDKLNKILKVLILITFLKLFNF